MTVIEILVIVATVAFLGWMVGRHFYRKAKHLPTGECSCCSPNKHGSKLVKKYHKKYGTQESSCCCGNHHEESCCCHNGENDK